MVTRSIDLRKFCAVIEIFPQQTANKLHGSHVGVEYEPDKVLSFQPVKYTGIAAAGLHHP